MQYAGLRPESRHFNGQWVSLDRVLKVLIEIKTDVSAKATHVCVCGEREREKEREKGRE